MVDIIFSLEISLQNSNENFYVTSISKFFLNEKYPFTLIHIFFVIFSDVILGLAASVWLMIRLQMIGVAMVTMVSFLAVIEHHVNSVDPGTLSLRYFSIRFAQN